MNPNVSQSVGQYVCFLHFYTYSSLASFASIALYTIAFHIAHVVRMKYD